MASRNVMIGTGAALAGLGGLAGAAVVSTTPEPAGPKATPAAKPVVETQTVIVRRVEHRTVRVKAKHHRTPAASAARVSAAAPVAAAPVVASTPVVATAPAHVYAPVQTRTSGSHATTHSTAPIRTRTSGGGGGSGERDDSAEHADD